MSLKSKRSRNGKLYRSGLERKFAELAPRRRYLYEPYDVPYVMHRKYKPDFVDKKTGDYIETKGFFRTGDTQKYTSIRDSIKPIKLIFVLSDPDKKLRKGAKMTMGQWCDKEGFEFYTVDEYMSHVINNG
mgnify:FL=1|jgi:hypothetical protein